MKSVLSIIMMAIGMLLVFFGLVVRAENNASIVLGKIVPVCMGLYCNFYVGYMNSIS
jgi:ABC-type multidrug transport system permease subunit